jgi:hypothetical protein
MLTKGPGVVGVNDHPCLNVELASTCKARAGYGNGQRPPAQLAAYLFGHSATRPDYADGSMLNLEPRAKRPVCMTETIIAGAPFPPPKLHSAI